MDKELLELEAELRCLRPRAASPRLLAAIECDLAPAIAGAGRRDHSAPAWTSSMWANWAAVVAAVVVVALASRFWPHDVAPASRAPAVASAEPARGPLAGYKPVAAERTVYGADDEGIVTLPDGRIGRRLRSHYVDTITWQSSAGNASLRWSVPSEEVRIVPVSAY